MPAHGYRSAFPAPQARGADAANDGYPALAAYKARCEARPAFGKALADHMAAFSPAAG